MYRPCFCKDRKALFHRWEEKAQGIGVGGHTIGSEAPKTIQVKQILAIVEYEDGTVHEAYPDEIRFLDTNRLMTKFARKYRS